MYGGYKNEQRNVHFVREMPIKQEVVETSEVVETYQPHLLPTPTSTAKNNECILPKKRKAKRVCKIVDKIAMKKKKRDEKNKTFE